ncbi:hypothetical protein ACJJIG_14530 [Microbulbifer sp. SSSA007]|nr:hypothetical protein [Microbulbifer variabilis]
MSLLFSLDSELAEITVFISVITTGGLSCWSIDLRTDPAGNGRNIE